jgi:hypothetical protein
MDKVLESFRERDLKERLLQQEKKAVSNYAHRSREESSSRLI